MQEARLADDRGSFIQILVFSSFIRLKNSSVVWSCLYWSIYPENQCERWKCASLRITALRDLTWSLYNMSLSTIRLLQWAHGRSISKASHFSAALICTQISCFWKRLHHILLLPSQFYIWRQIDRFNSTPNAVALSVLKIGSGETNKNQIKNNCLDVFLKFAQIYFEF